MTDADHPGKLIVVLDCCCFNGRDDREDGGKMLPDNWADMTTNEKEIWVSGKLSTGAHDVMGRISIPQQFREEGRGYIFEDVEQRPNGSNIAVGRICYFDYCA